MSDKKTPVSEDKLKKVEEPARDLDFRAQFRPDPTRTYIFQLPPEVIKEGYRYKRVREAFRHDPWNLDAHMKRGWDFVRGAGKVLNGRLNSVTSDTNIRDDVFRIVSKDGSTSYWMEITEEKFQANHLEDKKERDEFQARSVTQTGTHKGFKHTDKHIIEPDALIG